MARATASHNTLTLAEKSSSRLIAHRKFEAMMGAAPIRYPDSVDWQAEAEDGAAVLQASHDGYHRRHELIHHRRLTLAADGNELIYTYDSQKDRTGITNLLKDLADAGVRFKDLHTTQSSLEDIFVDLVRGKR